MKQDNWAVGDNVVLLGFLYYKFPIYETQHVFCNQWQQWQYLLLIIDCYFSLIFNCTVSLKFCNLLKSEWHMSHMWHMRITFACESYTELGIFLLCTWMKQLYHSMFLFASGKQETISHCSLYGYNLAQWKCDSLYKTKLCLNWDNIIW